MLLGRPTLVGGVNSWGRRSGWGIPAHLQGGDSHTSQALQGLSSVGDSTWPPSETTADQGGRDQSGHPVPTTLLALPLFRTAQSSEVTLLGDASLGQRRDFHLCHHSAPGPTLYSQGHTPWRLDHLHFSEHKSKTKMQWLTLMLTRGSTMDIRSTCMSQLPLSQRGEDNTRLDQGTDDLVPPPTPTPS